MDDLLTIQLEDNISGLSLVQFAPVWFFAAWSPLTFKAGCDWITVECTGETGKLIEKFTPDNNLGYQDVSITGELAKIRPEINAILWKYRGHQCLVKCRDLNGNLRLAGTLKEPLVFTDSSATGAAAADGNGYQLSWNGKCRFTALFLEP